MKPIALIGLFFTSLSLACSDFTGLWVRKSCSGVGIEFLGPHFQVAQIGCEKITLGDDVFITDAKLHENDGMKYTAVHLDQSLSLDFSADIDGVQGEHRFRFTDGKTQSLHWTAKRVFKGKLDLDADCVYEPFKP